MTQPCNRMSDSVPPLPLCGKCPKVYTGTTIMNKCPLSEPIHLEPTPAYTCANNKNLVYGFWCSHPECTRTDGGPSLIKVGQTGGGKSFDRVGQQLDQVEKCNTIEDLTYKEVATHFYEHRITDNKSSDSYYQFCHFSILQQLDPNQGEKDRLAIERALILRFHTNHPDFGVNGSVPNPDSHKSSSNSSTVAYGPPAPRGPRLEPQRPVLLKLLAAIAIKQNHDLYQATTKKITEFIQKNFDKYNLSAATMRHTMKSNADQDFSTHKTAKEERNDWFYTSKRGNPKGGPGGSYTYGFSLPRWPQTNAKIIELLNDEETINNLRTIASEGINLHDILDLARL